MAERFPAPKALSFDGNVAENWRRWLQQYELYMCATEKDKKSEKLQCAALLTLAGEQAIEVFNTFIFQEDEQDKIKSLIEKFEEYCSPKKHETYERHVFNSRIQKPGETVDQFLTDLTNLARNCEFGNLKNSLIRDRIVEGLASDETRARLLRERDLNLERCKEICRAAERASFHMKSMTDQSGKVDAVRANKSGKKQRSKDGSGEKSRCSYCGKTHERKNCPAYGKNCLKCGKRGHFKVMCRSKEGGETRQADKKTINSVDTESTDFVIDTVTREEISGDTDPWIITVEVNSSVIPVKLDTGSDVNILSFSDYKKIKSRPKLKESKVKLTAYNGGTVPVKGQCILDVQYKDQKYKVLFIISDSEVKPILGRKACDKMNLVKRVLSVSHDTAKSSVDLFGDYPDLFEGLGCLPGKVKIKLQDDAQPVVEPCRKVPFAQHEELKKELERMESLNVIQRVEEPTEWVNSMVIVTKPNGNLRICLDPRNLNKAIQREHFKLPTREEIMSNFAGAKIFTKLDASSGFWQLQLDDESSKLCTFNTPFGRYRYLRLPFGISSAPEIYHRTVHNLFEHMKGVDTSIDDIIVWGNTVQEHDENLRRVLSKAREAGLKLQKEKCQVGVSELTFIGEKITSEGVKPDPRKVEAIKNMEPPTCKKDLQRFLGMVNYLARFISDLSQHTALLRTLLNQNVQWTWTENHQKSFENLQSLVSSEQILQYYDPNRAIRISTDASLKGLGAVLTQSHEGEWLPVAYASRALTEAESRYATIEKEALAIAYACDRFHQYVFGQTIEIETDHKPLVAIFSKSLYDCPLRIQRLRLRLQKYDLKLIYTPGKYMFTPDTLSRAPTLTDTVSNTERDVEAYVEGIMAYVQVTDRKKEEIKTETENDPVMKVLTEHIMSGWPEHRSRCQQEVLPYWNYRDELSVVDGFIMKGTRIVIPAKLRTDILAKIHAGHLGIEKCRKRAREVVFWPGLNQDINNTVQSCEAFQVHQRKQPSEPLLSHSLPTRPWEKVSADLMEIHRKDFLIVVDAYSSFPEVSSISSQTSGTVINSLKNIYARHGIPEELFSDNGPCFSSMEFKQFSEEWNFSHQTSSPLYPKSNGLAERAVQTVKAIIKKCMESGEDIQMGLLAYRTTPLECGLSPAQMLMGRRLRNNLPAAAHLLQVPESKKVMKWRQEQRKVQKFYHDTGVKDLKPLVPGEQVRVWNKNKWSTQGFVQDQVAPRSYTVQTREGVEMRRNRRDIKPDRTEVQRSEDQDQLSDIEHEDQQSQISSSEQTPQQITTRSGRTIKRPVRLIAE